MQIRYTVPMEHWPQEIYSYITEHSRFDDPLLQEMEERARASNFPIIGPLVGPWLYLFTQLTGARHVFEMGSGFGYSTWYFAKALEESGGQVVHTVWEEDLSAEAKVWLERADLLKCCDFEVSESTLALESAQPGIDIIFMDIDKEGYMVAMPVIEQRLRKGGLLLIDNTLMHGRVIDTTDTAEDIAAIREMNDYLHTCKKWQYVINPLRDGLGVARFSG